MFSLPRLSMLGLLVTILAACGPGTQARSTGAAASPSPRVHLPADQAAHASVKNEWWYVVGHMHSGTRTFGFEVTIFKVHNIRPPGFASPVSLFRSDVAITDENAHRFYHAIKYYFPSSAHVSTSTLDTRVPNASLLGSSPASMDLRARMSAGSVSLHLSSRRPPLNVGGKGYIHLGNGYSYYYSLTDIAASGRLTLHGHSYRVTGISWLDHQWGDWAWTSIRGWTWMALQLNNGAQLNLADFRGTTSRVRGVTALLPSGRQKALSSLSITGLGTWLSPHTGGRYPAGWIVHIPGLKAALRVQPTVSDQEMTVPGQTIASYWEGSGRVSGSYGGHAVTGYSYTELVGYAGKTRLPTP